MRVFLSHALSWRCVLCVSAPTLRRWLSAQWKSEWFEFPAPTRLQMQERREAALNENFGNLKSISYRVVINGAKHNNFSNDAMMEAALLKPKEFDAQRRIALVVRAYLLAFSTGICERKSFRCWMPPPSNTRRWNSDSGGLK